MAFERYYRTMNKDGKFGWHWSKSQKRKLYITYMDKPISGLFVSREKTEKMERMASWIVTALNEKDKRKE